MAFSWEVQKQKQIKHLKKRIRLKEKEGNHTARQDKQRLERLTRNG